MDNRKTVNVYLTLLTIILTCLTTTSAFAQSPATAERIALAAYRNGQWDIYAIGLDGQSIYQLTNDPYEDSDPAYSPDGSQIAYASRRNKNWDIYLIDLQTGQQRQVTTVAAYDGAPAWHPDGQSLAYESYQSGDLEVWQVALADQSTPVNLTTYPEVGDFAPAWHPDGKQLAFSSWRAGNNDIWLLDTSNGNVSSLTSSPAAETGALWSPDGNRLMFVQDNLGSREVFSRALTNDTPPVAITWLGRSDGPVWSPDGDTIAVIFQRWDGSRVMQVPTRQTTHRLPQPLTELATIQGRLSWHPAAIDFGQPLSTLQDIGPSPLYEERLTPNIDPEAEPYNLIRQNDIDSGSPWLADTVDDSFQAWRQRMQAEVGYDFLQQLSDMHRDASSNSETSQYASWHKSGRAIDTLFDYFVDDQLVHEIVKEQYGGETYWRVFLRCQNQSGQCGRPLTANPWNYSARARTEIAPEQGGIEKPNLSGYYLDLTALANEYGWKRISSYEDEDYSWTWHFLAFEYWHYQRQFSVDQSVNWYRAMQEVYPQATLDEYFTWQKMVDAGEDPYLVALKGVPIPLEMKPWWALIQ